MPDGIDRPGSWGEIEEELKQRVGTPLTFVPSLVFYHDFVDEWLEFDPPVRKGVADFLKSLQEDPCSPYILKRCQQTEHYFACGLDCGAVIYWKLELRGEIITVFHIVP